MATEHSNIRLPVEIWSYVFLHLDIDRLRFCALTCSSFRWLARRYMYSRLTIVCEYSWEAFIYSFKTSQRRGLADALDRLRFVASPDIAPLIRVCSLQFQTWPDPPFEPVLNFLCDHLHLLVNIQILEFHNVLLTPRRASDISTLPSLRHLYLKECMLQTGTVFSKISTMFLTISRDDNAVYNPDNPTYWLALFEPEKLLGLKLVTSRATQEALAELTNTDIVLPRLRSLHFNRDRKTVRCPKLSAIINKCPSLLHLYLLRKPEFERSPEVAILGEDFCCSLHGLFLYDGPHFLIPSFQEEQMRGLRRVRLFGDRWDGTCDMIGIRDDLWHLHRGAPKLESLHLRAFHTSEVCNMIASLFPTLQSLAFSLPNQTSAEDPMLALTREPFLESLIRMTLPLNLKNLVVFGMIFSDSTEGSQVIEALVDKYDSLQHIFLYFPQDFWMTWTKTPSTESCTSKPKHYSKICKRLDVPSWWF